MNEQIKKEYNIGLDIGTESVGWAVVNPENYKVIRKGNKALWGARLFDEADTAAERRTARSTRRRYDRRRERIRLLQEEFNEEISKIDNNFYTKLKESFYNEIDTLRKTIKITPEERKAIKEYNKKRPTIYHLREKLLTNKEQEDIRLVYLAIHHIIKYRGNFLYNGNFSAANLDIESKLKNIFENLSSSCKEIELNIEALNTEFYNELSKALLSQSKNDKKVLTKNILSNKSHKNFANEFIKLIVGNQFSIAKLLNIDLEEDIEISFKDDSYEEKYTNIEKALGDKIELIEEFKELYDMLFLKQLFKNNANSSLSSLMVYKYDKHKEDLKSLKKLFKCDMTVYKEIFKNKLENTPKEELCLYRKYVNNNLDYHEFKTSILNKIKNIKDKIEINADLKELSLKIEKELEEETFLPKITESDNGKYPYQLNKDELIKIIENQGKYYPFLLEKINDEYKLVKLLSFRIPYYVGPLNTTTNKAGIQNKNAWLEKRDKTIKITPYNFDSIIDKEVSAERFITRMISHCTYIPSEEAIPASSILYSKFKVLNELKQIKINNERMSNDFQHQVYKNLFLKENGAITERKFIDYLRQTKEYCMYPEFLIEGYSKEHQFANNMQSYVDFFGEDGIFKDTYYDIKNAEEIIKWITIFEDKDILETKIRNKYNDLSEEAINKIVSKKYKGWSNLSEKLLTNVYYKDKVTGINKSIMDLMYETTDNFMQILNNKEYKLQNEIDKLNKIENLTKIDYSLVENLATSPATKKGIYQALKVVEEIVDYMGYEPSNIMIEMARSEDLKKARKDNKKDYINKQYENFKDEISNYNKLKQELNSYESIDSQKLFLYFVQEGKSLYSGTPLNIEDLDTTCEIDHIIPRTLIKDDSIDNKALVLKEENQMKAASFIVPANYRVPERIAWWKHLQKCNLLSTKKFNNLVRSYYSDKDIEGFINRQLVETRQITKHVANILNNFYKKTKIVYLHADLSSNYREKYELFKYRDLNDYHHAHDAYLAAVLGEYKEKYLMTTDFNRLKERNRKLYEEKKYNELKYGYVINSIDNEFPHYNESIGEILFDADVFNKTVEETLYRNDILISKKVEIKTGEFYNQTKNKKGQKGVSLKKDYPTELYGSYTRLNPSYAAVVKYKEKEQIKQRLIGIPIYIAVKKNKEEVINYIAELLKIKDRNSIEIVKDKIPFNTIMNWNGCICSLVGAPREGKKVAVCNCKEFNIEKGKQREWKYALNRLFNSKRADKIDDIIYDKQLAEILYYIINKIEIEYELYRDLLPKLKQYISDNTIQAMNIEEKEKVLFELFKMLKFNSTNANLKVIDSNAPSEFGRITDRTIEHAIIINKSITGLKERKYEF